MTQQTITVTVGGEDYQIPAVANFAALERIWPGLKAYNAAEDGIVRVAAAIALLSAAAVDTHPKLTVPEIKRQLRVRIEEDERPGILNAVGDLLVASGLVPKEPTVGEAEPAGAPAAGTETGVTS